MDEAVKAIIEREEHILARECVDEDGQLDKEKLRKNQEYLNKLRRELRE